MKNELRLKFTELHAAAVPGCVQNLTGTIRYLEANCILNIRK